MLESDHQSRQKIRTPIVTFTTGLVFNGSCCSLYLLEKESVAVFFAQLKGKTAASLLRAPSVDRRRSSLLFGKRRRMDSRSNNLAPLITRLNRIG